MKKPKNLKILKDFGKVSIFTIIINLLKFAKFSQLSAAAFQKFLREKKLSEIFQDDSNLRHKATL